MHPQVKTPIITEKTQIGNSLSTRGGGGRWRAGAGAGAGVGGGGAFDPVSPMTTRRGTRTLLPLTLNPTMLFAAILDGDQTPNASMPPMSPVGTGSFSGWDLHVEQAAAATTRGRRGGRAGRVGRPLFLAMTNNSREREKKNTARSARHNILRAYT